MTFDEMIIKINDVNESSGIELNALPHSSNLLYQLQKRKTSEEALLNNAVTQYLIIRGTKLEENLDDFVERIVKETNKYMSIFWPPKNNPYVHQSDFGSSIVPEMLCLIFNQIIKNDNNDLVVCAQKDLAIECVFDFTDGGSIRFKNKKVDVAVVKNNVIKFNDKEYNLSIPLLAIECKTNLDKNMLSGIEFSVSEMKKTFPQCNYFVVTELSDFAVDKLNYASSGINEMYILRKQKRATIRRNPDERNEINVELVKEIAHFLADSLKQIDSDEELLISKMRKGKLIRR